MTADVFNRSNELLDRALRSIPLGTQTLSKSASQFVAGATPLYLDRGKGAHVIDVDGNEFLDYPMGLGPILLGHADPNVNAAIARQLESGITFSLNHPVEIEVAEKIISLCPGVEAVRFGKSGSDAVSAAVRVARANTGRDLVLAAGYHGWHDWYISSTTRDLGVPTAVSKLTKTFRFGDLDDLDRLLDEHRGEVAAVVLEPSGATVPEPGYLQAVIDRAEAAGALSVFDEVITGFRLAAGGARERYGVEPDLSCYGKALGNGMPISAIGGRWETMRVLEEVFFSGTHGGETLSLAAASAVLDEIASTDVLERIERLGQRLMDGMSSSVATNGLTDVISITGEPQRSLMGFSDATPLVTKSFMQQSLAEDRVLFNGGFFISGAHTEDDIDHTIAAVDRALCVIATGENLESKLVGAAVQPVFRAP